MDVVAAGAVTFEASEAFSNSSKNLTLGRILGTGSGLLRILFFIFYRDFNTAQITSHAQRQTQAIYINIDLVKDAGESLAVK